MIKNLILKSLAVTAILSTPGDNYKPIIQKNKIIVNNILKGNTTVKSFKKAKKIIYNKIYKNKENKKTIYCSCDFENKNNLNLKSCGLSEFENIKRAKRVEIEHIVPVQAFGRSFKSYRTGDKKCISSKGKKYKGRRCAKKVDSDFRLMEADLYNLYPANGYINQKRTNYSMGMVPGDSYKIGNKQTTCKIKIDSKLRKVEPKDDIKGDIARVYKYMDKNYPHKGIISKKNKKLLEYWSKLDPISKEECRIYFLKKEIQKNINQILSETCETKFRAQKKK